MSAEDYRAAIAAEVLAAAGARAELLASIVSTARSIFAARATSIALLDEPRDELVFEAVSGEGQDSLTGSRLGSGAGIVGAVLRAEEPLVLDDVARDPRFARTVGGLDWLRTASAHGGPAAAR